VYRLLLVAALLMAPPGHALEFFAGQLTSETLHRLPPGGMGAVGGRGDWLLSSGRLCAVVSDAGHPTYLALHGAALVDLWHCDKANDQWRVANAQLNLRKEQTPLTESITAGFSAQGAWLETRGTHSGVEVSVVYRLGANEPDTLLVETTLTRTQAGPSVNMFGSLVLHPNSSLTPFTVDSKDSAYTTGFSQPAVDTSDYLSLLNAISPADTQVLIGSRNAGADVSYSVQLREAFLRDTSGKEKPVHTLLVSGDTFSLFAAFTQPFPGFWSRAPGAVSLALGQLFDLELGESLVLRQSLGVSDRAEAAALLNSVYTGPMLRGSLDTLDAGISLRDSEGRDLNFGRPDAAGNFSLRLPEGVTEVTLRVVTPWSNIERPVILKAGSNELGMLETGAPAVLELPQGDAMSLVFSGGEQPVVFHNELTQAQVAGERQLVAAESYRLSLSGTAGDPREIALPAGRYRVLATRGPEFSVTEAEVELVAGTRSRLSIDPPQRVLESDGLLSADFHVHSGISFDSGLSARQRVTDFIAQGCEVLVPTEHNVLYDLGPTIAAMGLQDALFSFPGVEVTGMAPSARTPRTIGHSNVFPVTPQPGEFMGGNVHFEGMRLGEAIAAYKARFPQSLFQLNHPRSTVGDDDGAFFDHLSQGASFQPQLALSEQPNSLLLEQHPGSAYRDIDFDAIELLNGTDMPLYEQVREDWFALLKAGVYKVATANSDSHKSHHIVAYPRNMLVMQEDDPATVSSGQIMRAVRAGQLYGSTGPLLQIDVDGTGPGGIHRGTSGTLSVRVDSAPWVEVDTLRIWLNGALYKTLPVERGVPVAETLQIAGDGFVFVEALGPASAIYQAIVPGAIPFAFANPVLLDAQGDGWNVEPASTAP
tara:strand:- start:5129 stop:7756 length:2628 start_codon:yes stop_codon:yes gene_type:complete